MLGLACALSTLGKPRVSAVVGQGIPSWVLAVFPTELALFPLAIRHLHALFQSASLTKYNAIRKNLISLFWDLLFFFFLNLA